MAKFVKIRKYIDKVEKSKNNLYISFFPNNLDIEAHIISKFTIFHKNRLLLGLNISRPALEEFCLTPEPININTKGRAKRSYFEYAVNIYIFLQFQF